MKTCITTNKVVSGDFIEFKCPGCGERLVRSIAAREKSMVYKCKCGFTGP
ncbi:Uncharacterised protein [uncultured archaeon]|nr:Uncharacterised protein [uncultured archaeon]